MEGREVWSVGGRWKKKGDRVQYVLKQVEMMFAWNSIERDRFVSGEMTVEEEKNKTSG